MDAYFDSAIIVKLYVQEATSPDAMRLVGAYVAPYALTQWRALEVKNAIRVKAFRAEVTAAAMNESIAAFEQDIATGRWQRSAYAAAAVEQKADELSARNIEKLGSGKQDSTVEETNGVAMLQNSRTAPFMHLVTTQVYTHLTTERLKLAYAAAHPQA